MTDSLMLQEFWTQNRRKIISIFIAVYIYAVNGYALSPELPWREKIFHAGQLVSNYLGLTGANFAVFAPLVGHANIRLYALVRYDNGASRIWVYPCVEQWSVTERIFNDRFRKYSEIFRVSPPEIQRKKLGLWMDLARYIAVANDYPKHHPEAIYLARHIQAIPLPHKRSHAEDETIFSYSIAPEDLQ